MKRKSLLFLLAACLVLMTFAFTACKGSNDTGDKKIAIAMANSSASWQRNGQNIKQDLEKQGFTTDLQFADTAEQQSSRQISCVPCWKKIRNASSSVQSILKL